MWNEIKLPREFRLSSETLIFRMNPIRSLYSYAKNVLTNRQYFWHLFWMILCAECFLGLVIIHFVPCNSLYSIL